jgi:hypothetical protein
MLKTFLPEILDNFLCARLFGFLIVGLGNFPILSYLELDRGLEFHGVILIVRNPTLDFIRIIIIFEKGSSINLKLLFLLPDII